MNLTSKERIVDLQRFIEENNLEMNFESLRESLGMTRHTRDFAGEVKETDNFMFDTLYGIRAHYLATGNVSEFFAEIVAEERLSRDQIYYGRVAYIVDMLKAGINPTKTELRFPKKYGDASIKVFCGRICNPREAARGKELTPERTQYAIDMFAAVKGVTITISKKGVTRISVS